MRYENRKRTEAIFKEIDALENEKSNVGVGRKVQISANGVSQGEYWIMEKPETPQDIEVERFITSLKNSIQNQIDALKKELETL